MRSEEKREFVPMGFLLWISGFVCGGCFAAIVYLLVVK